MRQTTMEMTEFLFFSRGDHRIKHEQSFFRKVTVKEAGFDELMISY